MANSGSLKGKGRLQIQWFITPLLAVLSLSVLSCVALENRLFMVSAVIFLWLLSLSFKGVVFEGSSSVDQGSSRSNMHLERMKIGYLLRSFKCFPALICKAAEFDLEPHAQYV
jgi:hypothetical protein